MTEDSAVPVEKNFRSSYYKSLGFRQDEKTLTQLEGIIKADIIGRSIDHTFLWFIGNEPRLFAGYFHLCADLTELRAFCLKYTLASCYRSTVWKVLTGDNLCCYNFYNYSVV